MGLDIFFSGSEADDSFLSLRNHDDFFALLCNEEPEKYMLGHSDFRITHVLLDRMAASLLADCKAEGLSIEVPETLPDDFEDWDPEVMSWLDLLPWYLCIVNDLRVRVNACRFIICSWNA